MCWFYAACPLVACWRGQERLFILGLSLRSRNRCCVVSCCGYSAVLMIHGLAGFAASLKSQSFSLSSFHPMAVWERETISPPSLKSSNAIKAFICSNLIKAPRRSPALTQSHSQSSPQMIRRWLWCREPSSLAPPPRIRAMGLRRFLLGNHSV